MELVLPARRAAAERPWQRDAACKGRERTTSFYPPVHHESRDERAEREWLAKEICDRCPVRQACLDCALATREPFGIWGGLTEQERRSLLESVS